MIPRQGSFIASGGRIPARNPSPRHEKPLNPHPIRPDTSLNFERRRRAGVIRVKCTFPQEKVLKIHKPSTDKIHILADHGWIGNKRWIRVRVRPLKRATHLQSRMITKRRAGWLHGFGRLLHHVQAASNPLVSPGRQRLDLSAHPSDSHPARRTPHRQALSLES